jgi:hypothetical protein
MTLTETRYKVDTINVMLGLIGGFAGVIMTTVNVLFGWYPAFLFERSLIRRLFTDSEEQQANPTDMAQRVKRYRPFVYSLKEYLTTPLLNFFTCGQCSPCCRGAWMMRRRERYDKFQIARERLSRELDLLEIVKRQRMFNLLTQSMFAYRQAIFVNYADKYNLACPNERIQKEKTMEQLNVEDLAAILEEFNPVTNKNDHKLVNFLAGQYLTDNEVRNLYAETGPGELALAQTARQIFEDSGLSKQRKVRKYWGSTNDA